MKVAISYAKTIDNPSHLNKVLLLGDRLASNGIDFELDEYDFEAGNDLYAFMENLIMSPSHNHIIVICNSEYTNKANENKGGVGFEVGYLRQFMSDPKQTKILPLVFEKDESGKTFRPYFVKNAGYFDLVNDDNLTSQEFNRLVDFIKGKRRVKPEIITSIDIQNFRDIDDDMLPHLHNIRLHRKRNPSKRNLSAVSDIASYFEVNKFKDFSKVNALLISTWSGEGKTTIVTEFIYRYGLQFTSCFILDFSYPIKDQLLHFAKMVGIEIKAFENQEDDFLYLKKEFLDYFETHKSLLVFENAIELDLVLEFLPKSGSSRVIILSVNFDFRKSEMMHIIELPQLSNNDAKEILCSNIKYDAADEESINKIIYHLNNLPFALELANSYLKELNSVNFNEVLNDLSTESLKWEGSVKRNEYNYTIQASPSLIFLIEKNLKRLDITDRIGVVSLNILKFTPWLKISFHDLNNDTLLQYIKELDSDTTSREIELAKNILARIGLVMVNDNTLLVHSLFIDYLLMFNMDSRALKILIENVAAVIEKNHERQMTFGNLFSGLNRNLIAIENLSHCYYNIFNAYNLEKSEDTLIVTKYKSESLSYFETITSLFSSEIDKKEIIGFLVSCYDLAIKFRFFYFNWLIKFNSIDYKVNPFDILELLDRKMTLLRQLNTPELSIYENQYKNDRATANHLLNQFKEAKVSYREFLLIPNQPIMLALDSYLELARVELFLQNFDIALVDLDYIEKNIDYGVSQGAIKEDAKMMFFFRLKLLYSYYSFLKNDNLEKVRFYNIAIDFAESYRSLIPKSLSTFHYHYTSDSKNIGDIERYPAIIQIYLHNAYSPNRPVESDRMGLFLVQKT
jgi:hypothetical protein